MLGAGELVSALSLSLSLLLFGLEVERCFVRATKRRRTKRRRKKLTFFPGEEKNQKNIFSSSSKTGARVRDSVLLQRVKLHPHSCVSDSIVGWGSSVGQWARVCNKAVIGEDCHVKDEVVLNGTVVLPHKELKESQMEPGTIVM